ncbi:HlyD family efflux transporter periplasmic adaptor subunit, partial [Senegalia sp. (in: firmicutes)]
YSINELLEKKEALLKKISENNNSILSEESGIISYQFDDYEKKYSINNMSSLKPKDIEINTPQIKNIKKLSDIDLGDSIIKTIKDFKWFIAINIPIKDSKELNKEDNINIRIKKDNRKLKGKIIEINSDKNNAMILIELDSYLYKYYKDRVLDVDIILKEYDGLKIPSKAVVEKDGSKGVYTKNVDSIIKFKPINIIYEKDDFIIASKDEENRISVQAFDEVIIDGKMIESYIKE